MRKFIDIVKEAAMPFGRLGNLTGFTFGFESEIIGTKGGFADDDFDFRDIPEDDLAQELGVDEDDFAEKFAEWQEDHPESDYYEWIEEVGFEEWFREMRAFSYEYGAEDGNLVRYVNWSSAAQHLAEDISDEFGVNVVNAWSAETPIENKDYSEWHLEGDGSLDGDDEGDYGFELISPVFDNYDDFASTLGAWLTYLDAQDHLYTNRTTGLHINIGAQNKKIDPLKLLLFSGEKWMSKLWRHNGNGHTNEILPLLNGEGLPASIETAREITNKFIKGLNEKHFAINMLTLIERGYVEFRPIGNTGYQSRSEDVFAHISRFVQLIHIASDEQLYRREYAKKLGQLLIGPRAQEPVLNYEQKLVKQWLDTVRLYPSTRERIMAKDGTLTIDPEMVVNMMLSLQDSSKPIPDPVLRILVRQSGINHADYLAAMTKYTNSSYMSDELVSAVKARLEPLVGGA